MEEKKAVQLKYVLIGCGRIAINHIKAVMNHDLALTALCDVNRENIDRLLYKAGLAPDSVKKYTDYREMIEKEKPDLAAIATESGKHAEIALWCIERGIHVIIEKPMAMSISDADQIIRLSKEKNVRVTACHQNRFNIGVQKMRQALEEGRFGKISHGSVHVRWNRNRGYYEQAPWRGTWEADGGALMNQCIHGIDLLRWMMGNEIDEVYGVTRRRFHDYIEAEDMGMALVKFRNGAVGTIEGTTNVFPENLEETLYLFGENGTVKLGGKSVNSIDVWNFAGSKEQEDVRVQEKTENVYGNGHISLYADMIEAIKTGRDPYVSAEDGKRALELVLAVYESAYAGVPVKLPLVSSYTKKFSGWFDKEF